MKPLQAPIYADFRGLETAQCRAFPAAC